MPPENNFQHAKYSRSNPGERVLYPVFQEGNSWKNSGWMSGMKDAAKRMVDSRVRGVLFVSGYPYGDLFGVGRLDEVGGLKRGYSRGIPGIESLLSLLRPNSNGIAESQDTIKPPLVNDSEHYQKLDLLVRDVGNFSSEQVTAFQSAADQHEKDCLQIARAVWSGLNHHFGRVKGALHLLEFIEEWAKQLSVESQDRLLIQAHGHAGQLLGIISNLIAPGESSNRQILFQVLAAHHDRTHDSDMDPHRLERIYRRLTEQPFLGGAILDVVTYGASVRGGWDTSGIGHLLHFVNHRPVRGDGKKWLAKMELPQIAWEIPMLSGGDYVQQLAVAGTDSVIESQQEELVNQELREILEPYDGFERWLECTRRGTRCQNDGKCLLVDYQVSGEVSPRKHLFGHACYTEKRALLFNTTQIVSQFY